ncbi:endopygalactorunase [Pseudobacter ginsenosidimutans]|uniref:endopygalactorunase n=1 Tax=Pseudobacter ginsenosidimutans TaxID=661488 RepID=UPI00102DA6FC|nr:endopygalactorunase [Pseudobacter ginsenosidimutans]QEC44390.1 endopygalactorunase [Pseudobacter ginsenosidimutans]
MNSRAGANHVAGFAGDTILITKGSTYTFTVDTPADSGLVSTLPDIRSLLQQFELPHHSMASIESTDGSLRSAGLINEGDQLVLSDASNGTVLKRYYLHLRPLALNGNLTLHKSTVTAGIKSDLELSFSAGQRSPNTTVRIFIPAGIPISMDNATINVIGRGAVLLKDLHKQSIGRTGSKYSYTQVGNAKLQSAKGGNWLILSGLDLRPSNGADIVLRIKDVIVQKGKEYIFKSNYSTTLPEILTSAGASAETAVLKAVSDLVELERIHETVSGTQATDYTNIRLKLPLLKGMKTPVIVVSTDQGKTWKTAAASYDMQHSVITLRNLKANQLYWIKARVADGKVLRTTNTIHYYSGMIPASSFGIDGDETKDYTELINQAIDSIHRMGGGTLLFEKGTYNVRTIHLKSNVHLYVAKLSTIAALKGGDAPETTWFSDKKYRSGLSPTDPGPYDDPENYMTKQDVGHHYFHNSMFFATRENNIRISGNGRITGNGNLVTGDKVMNNAPDNRSDKMFTFKLCTNIEIGGLVRNEDLWYDEKRDEPYYILPNGQRDTLLDNMLHIDQGGHFVLLATGTDNIYVHDTYFGKANGRNARDIYDFMACNNVTVTNIYSKVSSDDIVKPGSDCSLGFTRPAKNYKVRNVIGDTNCNLFQVGSETADDIQDICVDNIYVLGANKAGFSISTNDGAHIKNIHLNCGHTGKLHSRSKMLRTFSPFFISISNRGRIIGAEVGKYAFTENGEKHNELLVKNVNIGKVENIILNGIDIAEVYAGSSYSGHRWKAYDSKDGKQRRATAIVAGYSLPISNVVEGGLDFKLPNGLHTGYIDNIQFNDVHILVKGTNPLADTSANPPELGVGQYNVSNLKIQPSYGLWVRHASNLLVKNCNFNYEDTDHRYVIFLDDVKQAVISGNKMVKAGNLSSAIGKKQVTGLIWEKNKEYTDNWKNKDLSLFDNPGL